MELSLPNHVHELDPGQDLGGRSKGFETEHGSGDAFNGAVILLDDIVEVFDLLIAGKPTVVRINAGKDGFALPY